MSKLNVADLRRNYTKGGLLEEDMPDNPVRLFESWVKQAVDSEALEPNAMTLATVKPLGQPNVRNVLLKGINEESIQFFTNYASTKAMELDSNPSVSVAFWWPELERQVRIFGVAEKLSDDQNEEYFKSRPRNSQIGAWASDQSSPIENRVELEKKFREIETKFEGKEIPKPDDWGGYAIQIEEIEFWQGRPGRLHDRIHCNKINGQWKIQRLQP